MQLAQFLRQLTYLAEEFGVAVFMTNQVVVNPDGRSFPKDYTEQRERVLRMQGRSWTENVTETTVDR